VAQVAVSGADGSPGAAVLAADALHFYEEVERDRPFFIVSDLVEMYRAYEVLREMSEDTGRLLVAGHDPDVMRRFTGRVPGLPDDLTELVVDLAAGKETA
jgi:glyoxylase-like metal-dependent hydrolase (beta-lactamase superfamily II)